MKKRSQPSQSLTIEDIRKELSKLEKRLDNNMDKRFRLQGEILRLEVKMSVKEAFGEFESSLIKFRNEIFTTIDPLMKDLETRSQEREIGAEQYYKTQQKLNNHEKRINRLEKSQQTTY